MILTAILAVMMLVVAGGTYFRTGTSSHPAVVMALFWFVVTALPILAVSEAVGSAAATGYLLAAVTDSITGTAEAPATAEISTTEEEPATL